MGIAANFRFVDTIQQDSYQNVAIEVAVIVPNSVFADNAIKKYALLLFKRSVKLIKMLHF